MPGSGTALVTSYTVLSSSTINAGRISVNEALSAIASGDIAITGGQFYDGLTAEAFTSSGESHGVVNLTGLSAASISTDTFNITNLNAQSNWTATSVTSETYYIGPLSASTQFLILTGATDLTHDRLDLFSENQLSGGVNFYNHKNGLSGLRLISSSEWAAGSGTNSSPILIGPLTASDSAYDVSISTMLVHSASAAELTADTLKVNEINFDDGTTQSSALSGSTIPGFSSQSDLNFRAGVNPNFTREITFSTSGQKIATITNNSDGTPAVGIGTNEPSNALEVVGTILLKNTDLEEVYRFDPDVFNSTASQFGFVINNSNPAITVSSTTGAGSTAHVNIAGASSNGAAHLNFGNIDNLSAAQITYSPGSEVLTLAVSGAENQIQLFNTGEVTLSSQAGNLTTVSAGTSGTISGLNVNAMNVLLLPEANGISLSTGFNNRTTRFVGINMSNTHAMGRLPDGVFVITGGTDATASAGFKNADMIMGSLSGDMLIHGTTGATLDGTTGGSLRLTDRVMFSGMGSQNRGIAWANAARGASGEAYDENYHHLKADDTGMTLNVGGFSRAYLSTTAKNAYVFSPKFSQADQLEAHRDTLFSIAPASGALEEERIGDETSGPTGHLLNQSVSSLSSIFEVSTVDIIDGASQFKLGLLVTSGSRDTSNCAVPVAHVGINTNDPTIPTADTYGLLTAGLSSENGNAPAFLSVSGKVYAASGFYTSIEPVGNQLGRARFVEATSGNYFDIAHVDAADGDDPTQLGFNLLSTTSGNVRFQTADMTTGSYDNTVTRVMITSAGQMSIGGERPTNISDDVQLYMTGSISAEHAISANYFYGSGLHLRDISGSGGGATLNSATDLALSADSDNNGYGDIMFGIGNDSSSTGGIDPIGQITNPGQIAFGYRQPRVGDAATTGYITMPSFMTVMMPEKWQNDQDITTAFTGTSAGYGGYGNMSGGAELNTLGLSAIFQVLGSSASNSGQHFSVLTGGQIAVNNLGFAETETSNDHQNYAVFIDTHENRTHSGGSNVLIGKSPKIGSVSSTTNHNILLGDNHTVVSGTKNAIVGGYNHAICGERNAIIGGNTNSVCGVISNSTIIGGSENDIIESVSYSTILGGQSNSITSAAYATILGGSGNVIETTGDNFHLHAGKLNLTKGNVTGSYIIGESNTASHSNVHLFGRSLSSTESDYTYMNNLDVEGVLSAATAHITQINTTQEVFTDISMSGNSSNFIDTAGNTGVSIVHGTEARINLSGSLVVTTGSVTALETTKDGIQTFINNKALMVSGAAVGIGTNSPVFQSGHGLHIQDGTQANVRLSDGSDHVDIANSAGDFYAINRKSTGTLKFRVNSSTEAMTVSSNGNVGINTTAPDATLHVSGTLSALSATIAGGSFSGDLTASNIAVDQISGTGDNDGSFGNPVMGISGSNQSGGGRIIMGANAANAHLAKKAIDIDGSGILIRGTSARDNEIPGRFVIDVGSSTAHQLMHLRSDSGVLGAGAGNGTTIFNVQYGKIAVGTSSNVANTTFTIADTGTESTTALKINNNLYFGSDGQVWSNADMHIRSAFGNRGFNVTQSKASFNTTTAEHAAQDSNTKLHVSGGLSALTITAGTIKAGNNTLATLATGTGTNASAISSLESATAMLNSTAVSLIGATGELNDHVATLMAGTGANASLIDSLESATATLMSSCGSLSAEVLSLESATAHLASLTGTNQAEIASLESATGHLASMTAANAAGTGTNASAISSLESATGVLNTKDTALAAGTGTNASAISSLESATGALNTKDTALAAGTGTNKSAIDSLESATAANKSLIDSLESATASMADGTTLQTSVSAAAISAGQGTIAGSLSSGNVFFGASYGDNLVSTEGRVTINQTNIDSLETVTGNMIAGNTHFSTLSATNIKGANQFTVTGTNVSGTVGTPGCYVGIGTSAPKYPLDLSGNISGVSLFASHDVVAYSDESLKDDVEPIYNALHSVTSLQGVTFTRNDSESDKRLMGFIAQDVEPHVPEVVHGGDGEKLMLSYQNMVALLTEAIKDQQKEIDVLKTEVKALKGE